MVKKVYIQLGQDGMPVAPCGFTLWEGARFLGLEPEGFQLEQLQDLPLSRSTLVHGWVRTVHDALRQIGATIPPPLDYPEELTSYLGRTVHQSTLGEVHKAFIQDESKPVFIKPVIHKMFTGHTIERFRDLAETTYLDQDQPVWVSSIVNFVSEYRCFVHDGTLTGIQRYYGDNWVLPAKPWVTAMIQKYKSAPIAYSLDVGVTDKGHTLLVEVNDYYSLGDYGHSRLSYTEACVARWEQILERTN